MSIDGAQGTQFRVVILTWVRSGSRLGHVADERRANVALTGARDGLIDICSHDVLAQDTRTWEWYFKWAQELGFIVDAERFLEGLPLPSVADLSEL